MIAESSIQLPDPGDKPRSGTLTTDVYERLRHEIMTGRLLPDEKLRIEALSQRYGVGSSPLREALNRLVAEGLVTQREQRGFNVSPVSRDELLELTRTRCWVNEIVLRESITHGDQRWEESVVLAFHRLSRTPIRITGNPTYSNPQWVQLHRAFHASLNAACPSRYLVEFSNMLHDCADRYRSLNAVANTGRRDVLDEHRVQETFARIPPLARGVLTDHASQGVLRFAVPSNAPRGGYRFTGVLLDAATHRVAQVAESNSFEIER